MLVINNALVGTKLSSPFKLPERKTVSEL